MAFEFGGRRISKVGVIGSGQIGPDIALHFAKVLQPFGVQVVVVDVSQAALDAGQARTFKKIAKGAETGAFKPQQAEAMQAVLHFTADYSQLAGAELVVEAATEDEGLKGRIFGQVAGLVGADAILLSNSSHLEPERIFAGVANPSRAAVAHYFFPAERNVVVEIVSGAATSPQVGDWLLRFYEAIGKLPFAVKSRYGYAVDPIFEGIFQAACLCVQQGMGTVKEVDWAAKEALGMQVGPFTAMNLTGGNPITAHGLDLMHERFASAAWPDPWYQAPQLLKDLLSGQGSGGKWQTAGRGEVVEVPAAQNTAIVDALRGAYLGLTFGIEDSGIIDGDDYELCLETALDLWGPRRLLNKVGPANGLALVQAYAQAHPRMPVPAALHKLAALEKVPISNLHIRDVATAHGQVRVVAIRRPKVLNALDAATFRQIAAAVQAANDDPAVCALVLTGQGNKSFVSGADIAALAAVKTPQQGYDLAFLGQSVVRRVELSPKPVVAALNGVALGGGLELALGCRARLAVAGHKALCGLPEANLGIIPGAGGTQRLPRIVGFARALEMLRTAKALSSAEALQARLVRSLHPADELLGAAVQLAADLAAGAEQIPPLGEGPLAGEFEAAACDIGNRSRAVDKILCEVVQFGVEHALTEGLQAELDGFARICALQDMQIGVQAFVQHGPKGVPEFVHA